MSDFPYILGWLPSLALDFEKHGYDYNAIREGIFLSCSEEDRRLIEWLETGFDDSQIGEDFYRTSSRCRNRFIREYFAYDRNLRTEKVAFLAREATDLDFDEKDALRKAFAMTNIIEREKAVDSITWAKIDEIVALDSLNVNLVLAFLAKFHLISRWNRLDSKTGAELFAKFVEEINDTYNRNKTSQEI
ncbi:MAG: DUF2764 family protein [Bacteroidales bacterium]|nr:DUF2764 family protein [Bacteroidales bacterium]